MLVKFANAPGTETFVEEIAQSCLAPNLKNRPQDRFFTTGSKRKVDAGTETFFTLVVVPHDPGLDANKVADGIGFKETADGVEVTLHPPKAAAPVRVGLRRNGRWVVER